MNAGLVALLVLPWAGPLHARPWKEVETFSNIRKAVDLAKLGKGEILGETIKVPSSDLGISVQTCYLVAAPPSQVVGRMQDDQSSEKVKASDALDKEGTFTVTNPAKAADFAALSLDPGLRHVRALLDGAITADQKKGRLNLSAEEAGALASVCREQQAAHGNNWMKAGREKVEDAFRGMLARRAAAFQSGGLSAMAPCQTANGSISAKDELVVMTRSLPKVYERFSALFEAAVMGRALEGSPTPPRYYWESAKVDREATFNLGAFLSVPDDGGFRALEVQYFVTSKYYTSLIFYEIWPVEIDGKTHSFVWRADFVSTPAIPFLKGIERLAAENIMLLEVKKSVGAFQKEAAR